ncbi:hypothetical protein BP00DRAFT_425542, partial [Aspergillus indologenus CBS 114.80]
MIAAKARKELFDVCVADTRSPFSATSVAVAMSCCTSTGSDVGAQISSLSCSAGSS